MWRGRGGVRWSMESWNADEMHRAIVSGLGCICVSGFPSPACFEVPLVLRSRLLVHR